MTSPLAGHLKPGHHGAPGETGVRAREVRRLFVEARAFSDQEAEVAAVIEELGGPGLPVAGASSSAGETLALGIGPAHWLIAGLDPMKLAEALAGRAAIFDQTHAKVTLEITGPKARDALREACRVDLHPRAFPVGRVAGTIMAHIAVVLRRSGEEAWEVTVPSTFAREFADWLLHAAGEFGCEIA